MAADLATPASSVRVLAAGAGWRISDVRCHRGPQDRPFEERHGGVSLAVVLGGTFRYRASSGRAFLYPGAVMLGAPGACFECGHEHGSGDHCLAVQFDIEAFEELAVATSGDARFGLKRPMLPALRETLAPVQRLRTRLESGEGVEEAALQFAETVVRALADPCPRSETVAPRDQRRIAAIARYMEANSRDALDLAALARLAGMGKFHFLRSFRRMLGLTPHQWLMQQRLRDAAQGLHERPADAVSTIAFDAGFGDLSTFNALFRRVFGSTPSAWRRQR